MGMPELQPGVKSVPVIVPTRDEQGAVARTVAVVWNVFFSLGRNPLYVHANCVGYAQVRTNAFQEAKQVCGTSKTRGLLLDDDILILNQGELRDAIELADRNNWNIVAPYRTKNNKVCICDSNAEMLEPKDYAKIRPWTVVPFAGLGFYYGDLDLDYTFHSDHKPF